MEFQQDNRSFCAPAAVLDTVAEQLADVDLTLPDYCPDIEKILKCTLIPKIQSKSLSGGQLQVDGTCVVNVLYVESEKKTIRCCEHSLTFSQSFSVRDAGDNNIVLTKTKPEYINCRALSPRRLVIHGAFSLYAKVLSAVKTELFTPEQNNLEVYPQSMELADLKSNCQEQFTISEEISVADKPAIESVLYSQVSAGVTDAKAISGKLMVNGEISIRLFYLTDIETGESAKLDYILPFNQIIDCDGIDENTENIVGCEVMSYDIRLKNDMLSDKPAVSFDAMLCVSAEGYLTAAEDIIVDAYSTEYASMPQLKPLRVVKKVCPLDEAFIEKLDLSVEDSKISKILDIYAESVSVDGAEAGAVKGKINLCVLALNEDSAPVFINRSYDYQRTLSNSQACNTLLFSEARALSISYRLSDDSHIEIRCELKITGGAIDNGTVNAVSEVEIFEDKPVLADDCALTLYFAEKGESLWNIAKTHNTRLEPLLRENEQESLVLDSDRMLLIPKV